MRTPWTYNVPEHLFLDADGECRGDLIGYYRRLAKEGAFGEPYRSHIKGYTFAVLYGGRTKIGGTL